MELSRSLLWQVAELPHAVAEIMQLMTKELGDPRAIDSEALIRTAKQLDVSQVVTAV